MAAMVLRSLAPAGRMRIASGMARGVASFFRFRWEAPPYPSEDASDHGMKHRGDGARRRGVRHRRKILAGEEGTEAGVLHSDFDGNRSANIFAITKCPCEHPAEGKSAHVQQGYGKEEHTG